MPHIADHQFHVFISKVSVFRVLTNQRNFKTLYYKLSLTRNETSLKPKDNMQTQKGRDRTGSSLDQTLNFG